LFLPYFLFFPPVASPQSAIEKRYEGALESLRQGKRELAAREFAAIIEAAPNLPEPYFYLGTIHIASGELDKAQSVLEKAVALKPAFVEALHALAVVYLQKQQYARAETTLHRAIEIAPQNALLHLDLGHACLNQNKLEDAQRSFDRVIALETSNPKILFAAYFNRAITHRSRGMPKDALADIEQALGLSPDNTEALLSIYPLYLAEHRSAEASQVFGKLLSQSAREPALAARLSPLLATQQRYAELVQLLEQTRRLTPPTAELLHDLGAAYFALARYAEAAQALGAAVEAGDQTADTYLLLGQAYARLGDGRAIDALRRSTQLEPSREQSWDALGNLLSQSREHSEAAVEAFQDYVRQFPEKPHAHVLLGEAYFNGTWMEQAISHFQKAVGLNPRYARGVYALAAAYKFMGDHEKAKTFLDQVLALDANHVRALSDLGELLGMEGEYEKAVALLEQAAALQPSYADTFVKLGNVHLRQKKHDRARDALRKAVELSPNNAEAYFLLSRAYFGLKETQAAQAAHERFRSLQAEQQGKQGNAVAPDGKR
jgi:superkiller protein 3